MTVRELVRQLIHDFRVDWDKPVRAFDPTVDDYSEITGLAILDDGSVDVQTIGKG
jgi:hypothetical protein